MYKTASHEKYNSKERVALSHCFIVHIRRSTSAKNARPVVSTFWYTTTDRSHKSSASTSLLKRFMFNGFFPQTSHDFLYNKILLGFLLLIPGTRESKLLQKIGSHFANKLHLPLRPICSPRLYRGNPFKLSLRI